MNDRFELKLNTPERGLAIEATGADALRTLRTIAIAIAVVVRLLA